MLLRAHPGEGGPSAGDGARPPLAPGLPAAVRGANLCVAILLLGGMPRAVRASVLRVVQGLASARSDPRTAGLAALCPIAPFVPVTVHRARIRVAGLGLVRATIARGAAVLRLHLHLAVTHGGAIPARPRARRPPLPVRPLAIDWTTVFITWKYHLVFPLALPAVVCRLGCDVPTVDDRPPTTGLAAVGPGAPLTPFAVHRTAVEVALLGLVAPPRTLRAPVRSLERLLPRAHDLASTASPGAI
mmetsp:Transcript_101453/g.302599  ORF Transcript_101453/g.302599 Transcript_101453/m.302599 type:complete len:244 (+) Transcript_101453:1114-1845(+)